MGFGLLFAGYVSLLFFKTLPPAMAAGFFIAYRGLAKLAGYHRPFGAAASAAAVLVGYFALYTALWLGQLFRVWTLLTNGVFLFADDLVYKALLLVFHLLLYRATGGLCREVGDTKGVRGTASATVFMAAAYLLAAARYGAGAFGIVGYFPLAELIAVTLWICRTAVMIYGRYMRIATPEIIDDENKKMREYDAKYSFRKRK